MKRQCLRSGHMKTHFPNIVYFPLRGLFIKSIYENYNSLLSYSILLLNLIKIKIIKLVVGFEPTFVLTAIIIFFTNFYKVA